MRVPHSHHDRQPLGVPMTPMIDVVFQLLVFFICTVNFEVIEDLLPTNLAVAGGTSTATPIDVPPDLEHVIVKAEVRGGRVQWTVNQRPCDSLAEVQDVLRVVAQIDASLPVILDVEPDVPLGDMIDVYDLCRIVGFEKIQFAASPHS
jgi:biopolymer transport protein ExbD